MREFRGILRNDAPSFPDIDLRYDKENLAVELIAKNSGPAPAEWVARANAYHPGGPWPLQVSGAGRVARSWSLIASQHWYDLTVQGGDFEHRFTGRLENGKPSFSYPAV